MIHKNAGWMGNFLALIWADTKIDQAHDRSDDRSMFKTVEERKLYVQAAAIKDEYGTIENALADTKGKRMIGAMLALGLTVAAINPKLNPIMEALKSLAKHVTVGRTLAAGALGTALYANSMDKQVESIREIAGRRIMGKKVIGI